MNCPVCDTTVSRPSAGRAFADCASCGVAVRWERPEPLELARIHDEVYFAEGAEVEMTPSAVLGQYLDFVSTHLDVNGRAIVDIGCGTSDMWRHAQRLGAARYQAVEPSAPARDVLAASGVEAVESLDEVTGPFDIALLVEVIEHTYEPHELLEDIGTIVPSGGLLLVVTPNVASLKSRLTGERWEQKAIPTHFVLYPRATLERVVAEHGFTPVAHLAHVDHGRSRAHHALQRVLQPLRLDGSLRLVARRR